MNSRLLVLVCSCAWGFDRAAFFIFTRFSWWPQVLTAMNTTIVPRMYFNFRRHLCAMLMLIIAMPGSVAASDDLWRALGAGGKVILMRHAPVERGPESGSSLLRDPSCRGERNLSSQGKRDAGVLGSRFRKHQIPVSKVMHSPFCRTTATAQIAFGEAYPA